MHDEFTAILDPDVPQPVEPIFQHVLTTYASESSKTVAVWRAVQDDLLDDKPHGEMKIQRPNTGQAKADGPSQQRHPGFPAKLIRARR